MVGLAGVLQKHRALFGLLIGSASLALALTILHAYDREELQLINTRFEWRALLGVEPRALAHVVIFNRTPEDEPPKEAMADHPWMAALMQYPMRRAVVADMVRFLAQAGAKAIILDNDFPQYSADDKALAQAINDASTGRINGQKIPVFMVKSVYRSSSSHLSMAQTITSPNGVLEELQLLDPQTDVSAKYTGTSCLLSDADQTVRRFVVRFPSLPDGDSVLVKAIQALSLPSHLRQSPDVIDINFCSRPNSEIFRIRPLTYLIEPERKRQLLHPPSGSRDVRIRNAIVIVGDGIVDTFDTPLANEGLNRMSGSEVLAHSLNTMLSGNWLHRLETGQQILAALLASALAGLVFAVVRAMQHKHAMVSKRARLICDCLMTLVLMGGWTLCAAVAFALSGLIIPIIVPSIAIAGGIMVAVLIEREIERADALQKKAELAELQYRTELAIQEAQSKLREVMNEKHRRREFLRCLNHDLKAPLTVLNWNLSKLQSDGIHAKNAPEKIERLMKTSDRLYELISQLTRTFDDQPKTNDEKGHATSRCSLAKLLAACAGMCQSLAEMKGSKVRLGEIPQNSVAAFEPVELSRVIENLIKNAIVHNPNGTVIQISVESRDEKHHIIRVSDNGKGIPPQHLDKIFDAEYRVNPGDGNGTGLGLSIVRSLVKEAGGEVSVVSTVGVGTTFFVAVVAAQDDDQEIESEQESPNPVGMLVS